MMKVAVVGAGVMGSGIALCSIQAGYPTVLFDVKSIPRRPFLQPILQASQSLKLVAV